MPRESWKEITGWSTIEGHLLRRKHFTPQVLEQIAQRIKQSEQSHTGELVVSIEAVSPSREPDSRMRALEVFGRLRVWDTPQNTGVLLYLALDRHRIELIADRGVAAPNGCWEAICSQLQACLRRGAFVEGILQAVDSIEHVCREYCPPLSPDKVDPNSLSDAPIML